ncbi:transcription initiation factor TFIID subunit 6 isoform X1 [Spinacia oleracea]|uniref:Transcription initiation factor TFIID subunit 6-like isoform X1 n=2 Tax=Spinacia oleracea TaxID=3562 RepID=A0A9R0IEW5_SPIOL|nr:transcription initiation factor TFIID subunit 6-like isoform X1 [Spinacia oleracea]XP_021847744.1 transcription initiation factor TFIID subunit 6-like isoform X1 [Spinacia oleracea]
MSIVPKETIEVIAQSVGINNLSVDAALTLSPDVEYRMRELMQEAIKCMRHSRRTILTTDDVDTALSIRNVEPVYGFASGNPLRFKRAVGHMDLFYIEDKDVDFKDIIEAPLPKAPLDTSIMCHWLAIEGVQPAIPENAPVQAITVPDGKRSESKDDGLPIDIKVPVQHVLSRELQLYFDKITELTIRGSETVLFKEALVSLATDAGLHPLVPYFTCFIADEVARGLGDFSLLFALMRLVRSLLKNPHIQIEPYLHQLMPSVVSCLVAKRLGNRLADNHWELRDFAAKLVASICKRFGHAYSNLQPRLTRTLVNAFLDPKRAITQHYGAIQGLGALGPNVVRHLILPNLGSYMRLLEHEMSLESQKNEMKRHEAWRVYGALLHAAGQCIYGILKMFPALPSPPCQGVWGKSERVNTLAPGKRKASLDHTEEQPPLKKVATDGPLLDNNTSPSVKLNEEEEVGGASDLPSTSKQMTVSEKVGSRDDKNKSDEEFVKLSGVLNQVWKEDLKSGQVLVSMLDQFGESIFPFIPTPELSLFL